MLIRQYTERRCDNFLSLSFFKKFNSMRLCVSMCHEIADKSLFSNVRVCYLFVTINIHWVFPMQYHTWWLPLKLICKIHFLNIAMKYPETSYINIIFKILAWILITLSKYSVGLTFGELCWMMVTFTQSFQGWSPASTDWLDISSTNLMQYLSFHNIVGQITAKLWSNLQRK